MQPIERDDNGTLRFKANALVRYLIDSGKASMNDLATIPVPQEDREQFYQLIGYSLGGYCELSMVSDESKERVELLRDAFHYYHEVPDGTGVFWRYVNDAYQYRYEKMETWHTLSSVLADEISHPLRRKAMDEVRLNPLES